MFSQLRLHTTLTLMKVKVILKYIFSHYLMEYIKGDLHEIVYNGVEYTRSWCSVLFTSSSVIIWYVNPYISMHTWVVQIDWYWHTSEEFIYLNVIIILWLRWD